MFEAYVVYTSLFVVALGSSYFVYIYNDKADIIKSDKRDIIWLVLSSYIIFYTIILGLRKEVGIDYTSYYEAFKAFKYLGHAEDVDAIFHIFFPTMIKHNIHYNFFIAFLAFALIYSLIKSFENRLSLLYIYIFYFFTNLIMLSSINIMRQYAVYFIVLYSFQLFFKKRYIQFILLYIIGFTIHRSCIIYLPFLLFIKKDLFSNRAIQMALLLMSFIGGETFFKSIFSTNILDLITPYLGDSRYSAYTDTNNFEKMSHSSQEVVASGMYKYFILLIDIVLICYSSRLKNKYAKYYILFFYNLYFIGTISNNIFQYSEIITRILRYFVLYRFYVLSIFTYDCFHTRKKEKYLKAFLMIVIVLSIIFFYRTINNKSGGCAPWQFI